MLFLREGSRFDRGSRRARLVSRVLCGSVNYQGPVCAECQEKHLDTDTDGEYVLEAPPSVACGSGAAGRDTSQEEQSGTRGAAGVLLGQVVATPEALWESARIEAGRAPVYFLDRHVQSDWGEVCDEDKRANDQALLDGSRVLSAYRTLRRGAHFGIITEAVGDDGKRAATTILLPSQY